MATITIEEIEMFKINDEFSASRDQNGWTLYRNIEVVDKRTQKPKRGELRTYHSNLTQICKSVIDKTAGSATGDVSAVLHAIAAAHEDLSAAIKNLD
jgi:hypothetical protein